MALKIQNENIKSASELLADGGSISQLPSDTKVYVSANSLNKTLYQAIVDGDLAGGGGAGSPDTIFEVNADDYTSLSGWATGDGTITDGSALPGGTLQGTFELISVSPAEGTKHFRFTQAAGSLDTYFLSDAKTIDEIWRGKDVGCNVSCKYDGSDNDIYVIVFDATNNRRLTSTDFYVKASSTYRNYQMVFTIPSTCTSIRVGFQVRALNSGKILNFDKFSLFDRPFVMANVNDVQAYRSYGHAGYGSTGTFSPYFSTNAVNTNSGLVGTVTNSATNGWSFTASRACHVSVEFTFRMPTGSGSHTVGLSLDNNGSSNINVLADNLIASREDGSAIASEFITVTWAGYLSAGQIIRTNTSSAIIPASSKSSISLVATAQNESVITPARVMGPVYYKTSASQSIPSGSATIVDFGTKVTDDSSSVTTGASWKFTAQSDGYYKIFAQITWATSFNAGDGAFAYLYKNGSTLISEGNAWAYTTGTVILQPQISTTIYLSRGEYVDIRAFQNNGAAKSLHSSDTRNFINIELLGSNPLVATPVDRVAYIKDVKASGTNGGSATAGSDQTRTLNTLTGDSSFASLSSNQITLTPGTYDVFFEAPAYIVGKHRALLYNVTAAAISIYGSAEHNLVASAVMSKSTIIGRITITTQSVFEVRHRVENTAGAVGYGVNSGFGDEVYTQGWIKKIK